MNKTNFLYLCISIASSCIMLCLGFLLGIEQGNIKNNTQKIIDIQYKDNSLNIKNAPENILFRINGEIHE